MSGVNGSGKYWKHIPYPTGISYYIEYDKLLAEIMPYLSQGIVLFDNLERRLTAFFSKENVTMYYSGRTLYPCIPNPDSLIHQMLSYINTDSFKTEMIGINHNLPLFNAVFINWYRPPSMTDKPDNLGYHSDDESSLASDIIVSVTICEISGHRLFRFRAKYNQDGTKNSKGYVWQSELINKDLLIMLPECQKIYKHTVCDHKKHLDGTLVTGGRINLTFRSIRR